MKTDRIKEHIRSIVDSGYAEPKWDRLVFGMGIGPKAMCKTPAEAFVSRMYDYYCGGEKLVFGEEKAKDIFEDFLKTWRDDQGLSDSEKKNLLPQSLKIAKEKISYHMIEAAENSENYSTWEQVQYSSDDAGTLDIGVALTYTRIALMIEKMIKEEKEANI